MSASAHPIEYEMVEPLPMRLRRFREQCGISRSELAVRTGLSRPTIWAWESGKTQPRLSIMIYAAKLSIAALAGIKAQNVKISIEL